MLKSQRAAGRIAGPGAGRHRRGRVACLRR